MSATIRPLTGDGSPPVEGSYPQAVEVTAPTRWLYLSGQIPVAPDGSLSSVSFTVDGAAADSMTVDFFRTVTGDLGTWQRAG